LTRIKDRRLPAPPSPCQQKEAGIVVARLMLGGVLAGYLMMCGAMFLLQRDLQYFPTQDAPTPAEAGFDGVTEVALTAADGTSVQMWYSPAPPGAPTVLYFQGNAGEIADRSKRWAFFRAQGFGVAFLSYRGFGGSGGTITETGLHMDADAAHDWLLAAGVAPDSLALVGESLGSGVAVRLAVDRPVGALLLEAPYSSATDVASRRYPFLPVRLLMLDQFRSIDRIAQVRAPILIQHGERDLVVSFSQGQALFDAAPEPKTLIGRAGRGHELVSEPETWQAEADFIRSVMAPRT
jgi:fermentation-respiration switch protein FrsA (DUF1100 family)